MAEPDRRAPSYTRDVPTGSIPQGDVDALIFEVALLICHVGDQLLVDTAADIGQVDRVHGSGPFLD